MAREEIAGILTGTEIFKSLLAIGEVWTTLFKGSRDKTGKWIKF